MPTAKKLAYRLVEDYGIIEFHGAVERIGPGDVRTLVEEIRRNRCGIVIFDLRAVTAISTAGWGMIFSVRSHLEDVGAVLVLLGDAGHLRQQSAHGPLDRFIPVCPTLGKARIAGNKLLFEQRKAQREHIKTVETR